MYIVQLYSSTYTVACTIVLVYIHSCMYNCTCLQKKLQLCIAKAKAVYTIHTQLNVQLYLSSYTVACTIVLFYRKKLQLKQYIHTQLHVQIYLSTYTVACTIVLVYRKSCSYSYSKVTSFIYRYVASMSMETTSRQVGNLESQISDNLYYFLICFHLQLLVNFLYPSVLVAR